MGYPTIPSNCPREQQSTIYLSLNFSVGVLPHSTLRSGNFWEICTIVQRLGISTNKAGAHPRGGGGGESEGPSLRT